MRRLFTAGTSGLTKDALRWAVRRGEIQRVMLGVYAEGPEPVSAFDRERAAVLAKAAAARGGLAGVLHELDAVRLDGRPTRRTDLPAELTVVRGGIACANGLQTLIDLSATLDDATWERALESAPRRRLVTVEALRTTGRHPGATRIRRVLDRRGDVAPTESLLETLFVQLVRTDHVADDLVRQLVVTMPDGTFVATGSSTPGNRCTTPAARPPSWRRRDGSAGASPGTR